MGIRSTLQGWLNGSQPPAFHGHMDMICRELGWTIDERQEDRIDLWFKGGRLVNRRTLYVTNLNDSIVSLVTFSHGNLHTREIPLELPWMLIRRNWGHLFFSWRCAVEKDEATFSLCAHQPLAGLEPKLFRFIAEKMIEEASAFDQHLDDNDLFHP